jgi:ATP-binding protein involved in chromosome partitioning
MSISKEQIIEALRNVVEPDLKKDIVTLDLVHNIKIEDNRVSFDVHVSNPAMHSRRRMEEACVFNVERACGKDLGVYVNVTGLPEDRAPELRKVLPGVKNIIAIASGKGGVGKSTITANLAVGLAKKGFKVGLVDADIYGPSMPLMFDLVHERPTTVTIDEKNLIRPLENYGVKVLSIGFFADAMQAIVWRGPMASKALNQMFKDTYWGELDYLLIDLPPGTGDIHLSLVQAIPLSGAIIVSTPQEVALADAKKGVGMFQLDAINVPVLGIVENMAWFTPAELPDNKYYIFGRDGASKLADQLEISLLGQIPLVQSICESGDVGRPAILQDNTPTSKAFEELVDKFVERVEWRNENLEPTKMVKMTQ